MQDASSESKVDVSISPKVLETLAKADVGRQAESNGKKDSKANKTAEQQLSDQMVSLDILARNRYIAVHNCPCGSLLQMVGLGKYIGDLMQER